MCLHIPVIRRMYVPGEPPNMGVPLYAIPESRPWHAPHEIFVDVCAHSFVNLMLYFTVNSPF